MLVHGYYEENKVKESLFMAIKRGNGAADVGILRGLWPSELYLRKRNILIKSWPLTTFAKHVIQTWRGPRLSTSVCAQIWGWSLLKKSKRRARSLADWSPDLCGCTARVFTISPTLLLVNEIWSRVGLILNKKTFHFTCKTDPSPFMWSLHKQRKLNLAASDPIRSTSLCRVGPASIHLSWR